MDLETRLEDFRSLVKSICDANEGRFLADEEFRFKVRKFFAETGLKKRIFSEKIGLTLAQVHYLLLDPEQRRKKLARKPKFLPVKILPQKSHEIRLSVPGGFQVFLPSTEVAVELVRGLKGC